MKEILFYTGIFFFGAAWGSFFYALSMRYIEKGFKGRIIEILTASSSCPVCKAKIKPWNLIPVLSYIFLRGRCSECNSKISISYPASEILYGLLLTSCIIKFGYSLYTFNVFILISISILIAFIDIRTMTIPDVFIAVFFILSIYSVIVKSDLKDNFFGFCIMAVAFLLILLIFPGSFGGGDLKYAAAIGFFLGVDLSIIALETSLISGALFGLIYSTVKKTGLRIKIPFAPFLTIGLITAVYLGREIIILYFNFIN
jgi:prepilin signal peptidase PulO-like enzyme (type II secretory pathway)